MNHHAPKDGTNPTDTFLGDRPDEALQPFQKAQLDVLLPFLKEWWEAPELEPKDQATLLAAAKERLNGLPRSYAWIEEFIEKMSGAMKFSRKNFINIHPSPYLPSVLAGLAATIQNPNNIVEDVSRPTSDMEFESIKWIARDFLGFDAATTWGNVVSGGTIANLTALLVARDYTYGKLSRPRRHDVGERGVIGRSPGIVLSTAGAHYSLKKALWVLGIGHENLIQVPVAWDELGKDRREADERFIRGMSDTGLRSLIEKSREIEIKRGELDRFYKGEQRPFSLRPLESEVYKTLYSCFSFNTPLLAAVFSAGTTYTGTLESLEEVVCQKLKDEDIHIHIDAALGGFALAVPEIRDQIPGLQYADSVTIDGHKLGMLPYPNACVIFRHKSSKRQVKHDAPYLGPLQPTIEGSRPGSHAAALWVAMKSVGTEGYRRWIQKLLDFTKDAAKAIVETNEFQILHDVHLNTIAFAPLPRERERRTNVNRLCELIKEKFRQESQYIINTEEDLCGIMVRDEPWLKGSPLVGISALRLVVSNPLVDTADIADIVAHLKRHLASARQDIKKSNAGGAR